MNERHVANAARLIVGVLVAARCLPAQQTKTDESAKADKPAVDSMLGKEAGDVRDDNELKMKMVWCPAGVVTMEQTELDTAGRFTGTTPVKAFLSHGYWLGKYEVTQAEWKQVMATEPWKGQVKEGDDFPAAFVSWDGAMSFGRKLAERERKAGRLRTDWEYTLPTEAQWERACRARTETKFSFGDDESKLGEYGWFNEIASAHAHRVGQKNPYRWGLHDMHGNLWEMCRDYYAARLTGGRDPEVVEQSKDRVIRGGGWDESAKTCVSAMRLPSIATGSAGGGFRVALTPVQPAK